MLLAELPVTQTARETCLPLQTLADVQDRLRRVVDQSQETKLQISAINTVARASACAPDDLTVDPQLLREHLAGISPAMAGLTKGSWSSIRSRLQKALQRLDVEIMPGRRVLPLSEAWESLYRALFENGRQAALGRMIGYFSDHGVSPYDVSDGHVERFAHTLRTSSLRGRPTAIVRGAIRRWNAAVVQVPGWPQQQLTLPDKRYGGYVLPAQSFSDSFQHSLSAYLAFLANPPDDDNAPIWGLKPSTLHLREFVVRQMASALVHKGVAVEEITSVATLARRDSVDAICDFFAEHSGRPNSVQLVAFLRILRAVARRELKDASLADWLGRRLRRLEGGRSRRFGMTEKNRRRLAVFQDPRLVRDLLLLPYRLLKRAESGTMQPPAAAKLVRAAVAIELEIMCPIRLQNLSELNADTDLMRSQHRKGAPVHLFIPGSRTKNGEDIELELPRETVALIDLYLAKYRNHLIAPQSRGAGPRYLFCRPNGTPKVGRVLADGICRVLQRELGITFNVHLFRHLGCYLYLRSHPGQIDVMRRVLGHRDAATTIRFYASVEQSEAFRMFDSHILQVREEALRPSRAKAGRSRRDRL